MEAALFKRKVDHAIKKVIEQGCPSVLSDQCLYYGVGGTRCPVGWMVPEEEAKRLGTGDVEAELYEGRLELDVTPPQLCTLRELQAIHDSLADSKNDVFLKGFTKLTSELEY